jgi:nifR3 family TIM-barrel protein
MNLIETLKKNPFVLAPMAGITDHPFRSFMRRHGSSLVVTELVSATGLEYQSQKTLDLMSFSEDQRPVGIQLFGEDPEILAKAARVVQEKGADFVDLNFGCPVPKVVKKGAGSAMLKDLPQLTQVLSTVKKAVDIPVTIKIRTGWDANSRNAHEVVHIAANEGISWVAIHGRTRAQSYTGLADWDFIAEVKSKAQIPILGNGDVLTAEQAVERLHQSGCDGIMIGRGALKNPWIFADALSLLNTGHRSLIERDYFELYMDLATQLQAHCDETILKIQLRKFAAWFSTGYPGSANFRKQLFQTQTVAEILSLATDFFKNLRLVQQQDTSHEPFLMGGHG